MEAFQDNPYQLCDDTLPLYSLVCSLVLVLLGAFLWESYLYVYALCEYSMYMLDHVILYCGLLKGLITISQHGGVVPFWATWLGGNATFHQCFVHSYLARIDFIGALVVLLDLIISLYQLDPLCYSQIILISLKPYVVGCIIFLCMHSWKVVI